MSEEMAVGDKASKDAKVGSDEGVEDDTETEQALQYSSESSVHRSDEKKDPEEGL